MSRGQHVLVVEDDVECAGSLELLLTTLWSCRVSVAHDGAEALATARTDRPDVVLLDLGLPDVDGFGVARALRAMSGARAMLIVAVTGYVTPEYRARALEAGCDAFVAKPFGAEALQGAMRGTVHARATGI